MHSALLLTIRFHDGRYHGVPEWPPSPARVFQALVAGAARGDALTLADNEALAWLEGLAQAPTIATPATRLGRAISNYVPNNDLDAVGRDPQRTAEIRTAKLIRPHLFDAAVPLHYVWLFEPSPVADAHAAHVCSVAERLYQLGRGVDMAWAVGEVLDEDAAQARIAGHPGPVYRPSSRGDGRCLPCPAPGSLQSLIDRHKAFGERFRRKKKGHAEVTVFTRPPKPRFREVAYKCPSHFLLFDLTGARAPWPQTCCVELAQAIRDAAAARLRAAYRDAGQEDKVAQTDCVLIGRGAANADKALRIRIVPLPSIGHAHVTRGIRRVLIEVPPACRILPEDLAWAFSGLGDEIVHPETGEVTDTWRLTPADDRAMLRWYSVETDSVATVWRSVTPLVLSAAPRRWIDPERLIREVGTPPQARKEAKTGRERGEEEARAVKAVGHALRHADISADAVVSRVQREPFAARGARAEAFAPGSRFAKGALWHVELRFAHPVSGPLVVGDGRYLGLGLMAPVDDLPAFLVFDIQGGHADRGEFAALTHALRRAVIARVQALEPRAPLPTFFHGHEQDGRPARSGRHEHLAFAFDHTHARFIIIPPHTLERREAQKHERTNIEKLQRAMNGFDNLRAGRVGQLALRSVEIDDHDPLLKASSIWTSYTPYRVTRHARRGDARAALADDIISECRRIALPGPHVEVLETGSSGGLEGLARLTFEVAVQGPILIGKSRHLGGGLFVGQKPQIATVR